MSEDSDSEEVQCTAEEVLYCGVCGLPPEFCEYGTTVPACRDWLAQNHPDVHAELAGEGEAKSAGAAAGGKEAAGGGAAKETKLPGGKTKKKAEPMVVVSRSQRNKRKFVTNVAGLEGFGVKHKEASKLFANRFACGASVVKTQQGESIDIQGDVVGDIADLLAEKFSIKESSITILEDKKKKS
eukprot:CAMPEP_0177650874 /NCGR_PEP_ID=MMETSP0447-20121125/12201_1 /TAXON_ID=0 /ORGANISM="Stygamoeba regulata, Strain BSH-02190019" /LENGTH=183 /DNA_ID=CAMNT_0019153825 /DNA_START=54 /DNA_END=605 /DNA_ORIENTATION=+